MDEKHDKKPDENEVAKRFVHRTRGIPRAVFYDSFLIYVSQELYRALKNYDDFFSRNVVRAMRAHLKELLDGMLVDARLNEIDVDIERFRTVLNPFVKNFVNAAILSFNRIFQDKALICKLVFKNQAFSVEGCRVENIFLTGSDSHHHGGTVIIGEMVTKEGLHGKFVYKPSSVLIDLLIAGDTVHLSEYGLRDTLLTQFRIDDLPNSLVEMLNTSENSERNLATYVICPLVDRGIGQGDPHDLSAHYGYIDFLPNRTPQDDHSSELSVQKIYSLHAGLVAAMATTFGFRDVHCENLIISRLLLHIIDLENVFMPGPPHPFTTALFSIHAGGFYGQGKENAAHRLLDLRGEPLPILEREFLQGVERFFKMLLSENYEKIQQWLHHPIMQVAAVRVVPFDTQWLKSEKDVILSKRYCKEKISDEELVRLFISAPEYRLEPGHGVTDEGIPALIVCGDHNVKTVFNCFCENDIPAYRMFVASRHLLDPNYQLLRVPGSEQPVNYFLHSPLQAMQDRMVMMRNHAFYRDFLRRFINLHFQRLNEGGGKLYPKVLDAFEEIHSTVYALLDYARVISSIGSVSRADREVCGRMVKLAEALVHASHEIEFEGIPQGHQINMNDDYKRLLEHAQGLLHPYEGRYAQHVLSVQPLDSSLSRRGPSLGRNM